MIGWIIAGIIAGAIGIGGGISWSKLKKEHQEARNVLLENVDFTKLDDGSYHGSYAGGMYHWRKNECDVTVEGGKVTCITLTAAGNLKNETPGAQKLYDRILGAQTLNVDTISGATLTSKAYLKAVENALLPAQRM